MLVTNHILNMEEKGLQLNIFSGHVLAKNVQSYIHNNITVIACSSAEGTFLPPTCIMKDENKKDEFADEVRSFQRPRRLGIYLQHQTFETIKNTLRPKITSKESSSIIQWTFHSLQYCAIAGIRWTKWHSYAFNHTSQYLQPLDRTVFKSLKTHLYEPWRLWLKQNFGRRITRLSFGKLFDKTWRKAASTENAIAGLRATWFKPFIPIAIPDHAFT